VGVTADSSLVGEFVFQYLNRGDDKPTWPVWSGR